MILYPAIDILDGKAVRLVQGRFEDATTYHDDPLEAAQSWVGAGARILHRLHDELASRGITLRIVGARGRVRDLLRADGIAEKIRGLDRVVTLDSLVGGVGK